MRAIRNLWAIITGRVITHEEVDRVMAQIDQARAEVGDMRQSINALAARLAKRLPAIDQPAESGSQTEMQLAPADDVSRLRTARFLSMTGRGPPPSTPTPPDEANHVAPSATEK